MPVGKIGSHAAHGAGQTQQTSQSKPVGKPSGSVQVFGKTLSPAGEGVRKERSAFMSAQKLDRSQYSGHVQGEDDIYGEFKGGAGYLHSSESAAKPQGQSAARYTRPASAEAGRTKPVVYRRPESAGATRADSGSRMATPPPVPQRSSVSLREHTNYAKPLSSKSREIVDDLVAQLRSGKKLDPSINRAFMNSYRPILTEMFGAKTAAAVYNPSYYNMEFAGTYTPQVGSIGAPKQTQVLLDGKPMHANHVTVNGREVAIASQAPTPDSKGDFWHSVAREGVHLIVDLTNQNDQKKTHSKVVPYRPAATDTYGDVSVRAERMKVKGGTSTEVRFRDVPMSKQTVIADGKESKVTSLNYDKWPDGGSISLGDAKNLLEAIKARQAKDGGKVLVHCRMGLGRTGVIVSMLALSEMKERGELSPQNYRDVTAKVIAEGKRDRGQQFVQALQQENLIREFAADLIGETP